MNPVIYTHSYLSRGYTSKTVSLTGSNLDERIDDLRYKLPREQPNVFVSYKSDDREQAEAVAIRIAKCGLTVYLDVWDPIIHGDGPELVDYINIVIGCCKSLIAVLSRNTVHSWWVPLEIGIAITRELHLGSFLVPAVRNTTLTSYEVKQYFPSYLWKWPVLTNMRDLENWCNERKEKPSAQQFYESLKQRYPSMFEQG